MVYRDPPPKKYSGIHVPEHEALRLAQEVRSMILRADELGLSETLKEVLFTLYGDMKK